jgi:hypothetical protein
LTTFEGINLFRITIIINTKDVTVAVLNIRLNALFDGNNSVKKVD